MGVFASSNSSAGYEPVKAQVKWQQEPGISLQDDAVWSGMFTTLYKVTDDFKLKWLQMRIFHRILPTARLLHLYGVTDTDACTFCKAHVETIGHLFWYCRKVNAFWRAVTAALMPSQTLSLVQVITNANPSGGDDDINLLIILLGKQYIWRCRNSSEDLGRVRCLLGRRTFYAEYSILRSMRHKELTNQKTGRPFCAPLAHVAPVSCECHLDCHVLAPVSY